MKKLFILCAAATATLSGCAWQNMGDLYNDHLESQVEEKAGLDSDAEYAEYSEMKSDGRLDDEGYFRKGDEEPGEEPTTVPPMTGSVRLSISGNSRFGIEYFRDKERTVPISSPCCLDPGESIYASEPEIIGAKSPFFHFAGFRMWDQSGSKPGEIEQDELLVITIPADFSGTEVSVEPVGVYDDRFVKISDYCIDASGKRVELGGKWTFNNDAVYDDQTLPAYVTYNISYEFDPEEYYFVESVPAQYSSQEAGRVTFNALEPTDTTGEFEVQLRHYIDASIQAPKGLKKVSVNGREKDISASSSLGKLKKGDQITLDVEGDYAVDCTQLEVYEPEKLSSGYRYNITVDETDTNVVNIGVYKSDEDETSVFEEKSVKNAVMEVKFADKNNPYILKNGDHVDNSQKVTVTVTPGEGYYVSALAGGKTVYQDTMKFKDYLKNIDKILAKHKVRKLCTVTLSTEDELGTVRYFLDGVQVSGTQKLREEQKLEIKYTLESKDHEIIYPHEGLSIIDGFMDSTWDSARKTQDITKTISITSDLDGSTITREDYVSVIERG